MNYLDIFKDDLQEFYDKTMQFSEETLSVGDYKGFSGSFGSYAQRGAKTHMLRLRMSGGRLTKEMLKGIAEIITKFDVKRAKLTTCESIQLHDMDAKTLCEAILPAWEAGMMTRGGGGDFPRNIMCAPLSGVEKGEYFDVMPYALNMGDYMLGFIKGPKFPRKLKCAFTNTASNATHATIRDLGFAANEDGTFDVYICGGMGNNPKLGVKAAEHIDPLNIRYYAKAMVETFKANGNYENRGRARTRYMQETLGVEGLKAEFNKQLEEAYKDSSLKIDKAEITAWENAFAAELKAKQDKGEKASDELIGSKRVYAQKQDGLYAVYYQPIGGMIEPNALVKLYETIKDMDAVELRVTPNEGIYVINLTPSEAEKVLAVTADGARNIFETSVACVGAKTCQVGLGDSQGLLKLCVEELRKHDYADGVLPQIHISGCPSSCTGQFTASIGFRGAMKKVGEEMQPAFTLYLGGSDIKGSEKLSEPGPIILVNDIPKLLVDIAEAVSAEKKTYAEWAAGHEAELKDIAAKYA